MPTPNDDTTKFDAAPELDDLPSLPPEADLDIRSTGRTSASTTGRTASSAGDGVSSVDDAQDDETDDEAPWQRSELPPRQRRRRLMILGAIVVAFVVGAGLWAAGVGQSISGNLKAAVKQPDEREVREAIEVVPERDYRLSITGCDVDPETWRVTVAGSLTLERDARGGSHQVVVAFLDGNEDVTISEAIDNMSLSGPGASAPLYALGDVISEHPEVECVPLEVTRIISSTPGGDS